MLQGPPETAAAADVANSRDLCPECLQPFALRHPRQLFCSPAHRDVWHNRWTVRGRAFAALATAARMTRGGTRGDKATGLRARGEAERMQARWIVEDRAKPRMTAIAYVALRLRRGFDPA